MQLQYTYTNQTVGNHNGNALCIMTSLWGKTDPVAGARYLVQSRIVKIILSRYASTLCKTEWYISNGETRQDLFTTLLVQFPCVMRLL